jgi:hypothetical protein
MTTAIDQATARLMALLPAHIQTLDVVNGGALQGLMRVLASGGLEIDGVIDALLNDAFVETAGPSGLAALSRLIGAPLLASVPGDVTGANRAFIANTVRRRRAKGTARGLEGVAGDVTGGGAAVVESYQRLARLAHLIDVRPERPALAPLTDGDTRARIGSAFDRTPRLTDVRAIAGGGSGHGVPAVGVNVVNLKAPPFPAPPGAGLSQATLAGVPVLSPWTDAGAIAPGYFQIAARDGAVAPLINPESRPDAGAARIDETMLAARLRRLPLHREVEAIRLAQVKGLPAPNASPSWFDAYGNPFTLFLRRTGSGTFDPVPPERLAIVNLATMPAKVASVRPRPPSSLAYAWREPGLPDPAARTGSAPIDAAIDPVTGRVIIADPGANPDVVEVRLAHAAGLGDAIGAGPQERDDASVPTVVGAADFLCVVDPPNVGAGPQFVASLTDALAAWAADAGRTRGFIVLARCDIDAAAATPVIEVKPGAELHIVAAQWRPKRTLPGVTDDPTRLGYLVRTERRFVLPGGLTATASGAPPPGGRPGALILDGLSLAGPLTLGPSALSVLRVRYGTLRPMTGPAIVSAGPLTSVSLSLEMCVSHALALQGGSGDPIDGALSITRSIITGDGGGGVAITAPSLDATLTGVTLLGAAALKTIEATNMIATGVLTTIRRQAGCVRYSYLAPGSQAPRRFRCQPDLAVAERLAALGVDTLPPDQDAAVRMGVAPVFLDTDLDQPTVAMLSPHAPAAIRGGGEGGVEMGAFAAVGETIRLSNLASLFDDDLPVALEGAIIETTRSRATTDRRNVP